jgi:aspartokinase
MAIHARATSAISLTGGQIGLVTDNAFSKARVQSINKQRIFQELERGKIVIIAGFQGVTPDGDVTTLGRGGSNATLVAVGATPASRRLRKLHRRGRHLHRRPAHREKRPQDRPHQLR